MDLFSIPEVRVLDEALGEVLPVNGGDPRHLSLSALDVCLSERWRDDDGLFSEALDCASRFWAGEASDAERGTMRVRLIERAQVLKSRGEDESEAWCRLTVLSWSLDTHTPSNGYGADYLLEFGLKAGASVETMRRAFEAHVPGLSEWFARKTQAP